MAFTNVIGGLNDKIAESTSAATPEELAYLAAAAEKIGGASSMLDIERFARSLREAHQALADNQDDRINTTADARNAQLNSTGEFQNTRLNDTGDEQDHRLLSTGQKQNTRLLDTSDAQYDRLMDTSDEQNVRLLTTGEEQNTRLMTTGDFMNRVLEEHEAVSGMLSHEDRGFARSIVPELGARLLYIDKLGLFRFESDSTELDDDESCFQAKRTLADGEELVGAWLLAVPSFDLLTAWQMPMLDAIRNQLNEVETLQNRHVILSGEGEFTATSIANVNSHEFEVMVEGALVGDSVIVSPPARVGSTIALNGRLAISGYVSADNVVTVVVANPSAANVTVSGDALGMWKVTVVGQVN